MPDAGPGLAAADHADAAFDPQRVRSGYRDVAGIDAAVIGVVDLARPFAGTARVHAAEQRQADYRAPGQCRIGVLVVDLRLAGGRIDRLLQSDDDAANAAAAFAHLDPGVTRLGQPDAGRIAGALGVGGWSGQQ